MIAGISRKTKVNQLEQSEADLQPDEKDVEEMQKERMAVAENITIANNNVIGIQKPNVPWFSMVGYYHQLPEAILYTTRDHWTLLPDERLEIIQCIVILQSEGLARRYQDSLDCFQQLCAERKELDDQHKISILRSAVVV